MKVDIIAVGRLKTGPLKDLYDIYAKRLRWPLVVYEIDVRMKEDAARQKEETERILEKIDHQAYCVVLDERGNGLKSMDFARTLAKLQDTGSQNVQFVIGGADGLGHDVLDKASFTLSFGQQTWPHMLARVMLLEQIYRAQQILDGHPYHRE